MSEFEHDAGAAEVVEPCATLGIHERGAIGALGSGFMVIKHDHIHPLLAERGDFPHRGRAAIHREQQLRSVHFDAALDSRFAEAVALLGPQWKKAGHSDSTGLEKTRQDGQRSDAVHIVVSVKNQPLTTIHGLQNSRHGHIHFRQQLGGAQSAQARLQVGLGGGTIG